MNLETVGVFLGDGRGNFGKVMVVGFDPAIQVSVQFFPVGKDFPILSGDLFPVGFRGARWYQRPQRSDPRVGKRIFFAVLSYRVFSEME